jgi:apolipoprotein N-acyltransferase
MLLLSFPPYGIWPLAWIALVPSLLAQHRLLPLKWSSLAPSVTILCWLGPFMARMFGMDNGPFFAALGVLISILVFFTSRERRFMEITGYRWFILHGVFGWVGLEMIRATFIPLVATNAFIGYTQATQAWIIQPVSVLGVYALNLLIMLVNYALAQAAVAGFDRKWRLDGTAPVSASGTGRWLAAVGIALASWAGLSLSILNQSPESGRTVRVAALQPNFAKPAFQDEAEGSEGRFEAFAEWTRQAAARGAQLICTPEMAFNFDPQESFTSEFRALARETGAFLFITYSVALAGRPFRNEAVLLSPSGEFSLVYAKNHIPPGEPPSPVKGKFPVFETPLGRLTTLICHDANYTDVARKLTRAGAQLIAAPLNEFGEFGEQYWTNVTFRAVENRAAMIVTARQTGSAIIDPYGRQVALNTNAAGEQVVLMGDVKLGSGNTVYLQTGDWAGWLSLAVFAFFLVFQSITEHKTGKAKTG